MEKTFLLICAFVLTCVYIVSARGCIGGNGSRTAKAKFTVRVVDEAGQPVEGAKVWARFNLTLRGKFKVDEKLTNAAGEAEVSGRCDLSTRFVITKEGYYETSHVIEYRKDGYEIKDAKWQPYGGCVQYTLKKIQNPIPMFMFDQLSFRVPVAGKDFGFDMEYGTLIEPYGPGKNADFYVRYTWEENQDGRNKIMTISFPHCLDGAYIVNLDTDSKFQSPHHANPKADYIRSFSWKTSWKTTQGEGNTAISRQQESDSLNHDQCLIFRSRTKVDTDGKLVSAHYGKIYGKMNIGKNEKTEIFESGPVFFNPVENDTNLEFDNQWHAELRKQGGLVPEGGLFSW